MSANDGSRTQLDRAKTPYKAYDTYIGFSIASQTTQGTLGPICLTGEMVSYTCVIEQDSTLAVWPPLDWRVKSSYIA